MSLEPQQIPAGAYLDLAKMWSRLLDTLRCIMIRAYKGHCRLNPILGTPVVHFFTFNFGVSLLKLNSRKKGTLIINGLLGNIV